MFTSSQPQPKNYVTVFDMTVELSSSDIFTAINVQVLESSTVGDFGRNAQYFKCSHNIYTVFLNVKISIIHQHSTL
jgi:hypothetical protein